MNRIYNITINVLSVYCNNDVIQKSIDEFKNILDNNNIYVDNIDYTITGISFNLEYTFTIDLSIYTNHDEHEIKKILDIAISKSSIDFYNMEIKNIDYKNIDDIINEIIKEKQIDKKYFKENNDITIKRSKKRTIIIQNNKIK